MKSSAQLEFALGDQAPKTYPQCRFKVCLKRPKYAQAEYTLENVPKTYGVLVLKGDRYVTVRHKVPPPSKPGQIWKLNRWVTPRKRKKPTKKEIERVYQEELFRLVNLQGSSRVTPAEARALAQARAEARANGQIQGPFDASESEPRSESD